MAFSGYFWAALRGIGPINNIGLIIVATTLASISLFLFVLYTKLEKTMETHAIIAIIGYHIVFLSAVLWWTCIVPTYGNLVLFLIALLFTTVATGMAWIEHGCYNNTHTWFGALAYVSSFIVFFSSVYLTFKITRFTKDIFCLLSSIVCLVLSTVALISGMLIDYKDWAPRLLFLGHLLMIFMYITIGIVIAVLTLFF